MKSMNEATVRTNVNYFPGLSSEKQEENELSYLGRRLFEAGVIDMATSTKPPGFYVNWTTVTSLIIVVSAIAGLWWFTYQTANETGYQRGLQEAEKRQLQKQLDEQAAELKRTKEMMQLVVNPQEKK